VSLRTPPLGSFSRPHGGESPVSLSLTESAQVDPDSVLRNLSSSPDGLDEAAVEQRLGQYGPNEVAAERRRSVPARLLDNVKNPLVILLLVLALVSYLTQDIRAAVIIGLMVLLGVVLRFFQELRADTAAEKLKAMVSTTATVQRAGIRQEVLLKDLVPGDIIHLSAGDMVPADARLLTAKDLFVSQAALTGEAVPVEKSAARAGEGVDNPLDLPCVCFLGSNIESGTATAVVVHTGARTYLGSLAHSIVGPRQPTSFDRGVNRFTWLMISFMLVMVPLVFVLNGLSKHNWLEAFLFALAVAVGLTPEMLPMIVTVNLSKGAIAMSRKKVIVRRLNAIQNFGAMDVLCTDKTGTITQGKIILEKHLDVHGDESSKILDFAYLNSYYQTGLKNLLDVAVLKHVTLEEQLIDQQNYRKVDEIPFDFERRRMSVVVEDADNRHILICKGAVEEIVRLCTRVEIGGEVQPLDVGLHAEIDQLVYGLSADGFRVIALASREVASESDLPVYSVRDEADLTLLGFLAFLDPPKETASEALSLLHGSNVEVKILTGDNEVVTGSICRQVGLPVHQILLGPALESLTDDELGVAVEQTTVFAKLSPAHKERIIRALQRRGRVVGFMGDGINDAPALKTADVGISVDTAVDIAKESSDIILLENSLLVIEAGVIEGRRVFGNITKYIKMAASSNFGNMFSVVGASIFLPFLPMLPLQVLTNNLLYDFSQTTIPTDDIDREWLARPRKWALGDLRRFILYIGPISSIFDYATYFIMLYVFHSWANPDLFHTGWFVESLFTQTLIIHVIRTNRIPFLQSRASLPLVLTSVVIVAVGAWLPFSPLASTLGFVPLPPLYWLFLAGMLACYVVLTQLVKTWFVRRFGD
jgi:Mg2+-importing ATPase